MSDQEKLIEFLDKFRAELKGDLKDFKTDVLRDLSGAGSQIEKLAERVTVVENKIAIQTKRWPTSAVVLSTALLAACVSLLAIVANLIH